MPTCFTSKSPSYEHRKLHKVVIKFLRDTEDRMLHGMVRLDLYNEFGVDHVVPRFSYDGQEGRKEESKEFRLGDKDMLDKATIGLRL